VLREGGGRRSRSAGARGDDGDARRAHVAALLEVLHLEGRNPVYEVGHEKKIAAAEAKLPPWLHLAGSGFHGAGLPDCIKDGRAVAKRILAKA
jgi:protoporphyrinogen oxidase